MTSVVPLPERDEWTVDDLAGLSDDYRYELINGRPVVTSPIPPHQDLSVGLVLALRMDCPPGVAPFMETSVLVDRHNQPRPDVVALRLDHTDRTPVPVEDAVLIVEVLSKQNTLEDIREKKALYVAAGVPHYWVINPLRGRMVLTTMVLDPDRRRYQDGLVSAGVFETAQPWPVRLDLPAMARRFQSMLPKAHAEATVR